MKTAICTCVLLALATFANAETVTRTTCSTHTYANGKTKLECTTRTVKRQTDYINIAPLPSRPFYSDRRSR